MAFAKKVPARRADDPPAAHVAPDAPDAPPTPDALPPAPPAPSVPSAEPFVGCGFPGPPPRPLPET